MSAVRSSENGGSLFDPLRSEAKMNLVRRKQAEAGVAVHVVVPGEEIPAVSTGVLQAAGPI